jgi:hypothetical protein
VVSETVLEAIARALQLTLSFEAMELVGDPGLTMFVYTAEPGSKSEESLNLLHGAGIRRERELARGRDREHHVHDQPRRLVQRRDLHRLHLRFAHGHRHRRRQDGNGVAAGR